MSADDQKAAELVLIKEFKPDGNSYFVQGIRDNSTGEIYKVYDVGPYGYAGESSTGGIIFLASGTMFYDHLWYSANFNLMEVVFAGAGFGAGVVVSGKAIGAAMLGANALSTVVGFGVTMIIKYATTYDLRDSNVAASSDYSAWFNVYNPYVGGSPSKDVVDYPDTAGLRKDSGDIDRLSHDGEVSLIGSSVAVDPSDYAFA